MRKPVMLAACALLGVSLAVSGCGSAKSSTNDSAKALAKGSASPSSKETYVNNGKVLVQNGGQFADLAKFEATAKANPENAPDQMDAAASAYVNGKYDLSVSYYKKAIQIQPTNASFYNNLGNVYLRGLNQPKNALPNYQKALRLSPAYGMAWLNLGMCQSALGDNKAAAETLQKALSTLPKSDPQYAAIQKELKVVQK